MDKRDISQMEEKPGGSAEKSCIAPPKCLLMHSYIEGERFNVIDQRGRNKSFFLGEKTLAPRFPNQKCVVFFINHHFSEAFPFSATLFWGRVCVCGFGRWLGFGCGW